MPEYKLYLATNHPPIIRGNDDGIWDRIKMVPFNARFYETAEEAEEACGDSSRVKDKDLLNKLKAELGGILAWAVQGCLEWQRDRVGRTGGSPKGNGRLPREHGPPGGFHRRLLHRRPWRPSRGE